MIKTISVKCVLTNQRAQMGTKRHLKLGPVLLQKDPNTSGNLKDKKCQLGTFKMMREIMKESVCSCSITKTQISSMQL
jgi:hypothetical protein